MLMIVGIVAGGGIDYVTLTRAFEHGSDVRVMRRLWEDITTFQGLKEFRGGGYSGYMDSHGSRYGTRTRDGKIDAIVSMSGDASRRIQYVAKEYLEGWTVTRLDLQVTLDIIGPNENLASDYYESLKLSKSYRDSMVGQKKVTLYDSDSGQTLYIGARKNRSAVFRIYDKGGQSGGEKGLIWRFEVETKKLKAGRYLNDIISSHDQGRRAMEICASLFYQKAGVSLPLNGDAPEVPEAMKGDVQEWLAKCVRPVVVREVNSGNIEKTLESLGLSWLVEPDQVSQREVNRRVAEIRRGFFAGSVPKV